MQVAVLLGLLSVFQPSAPADPPTCRYAMVTGYWRLDPAMSPSTFDGTPILTAEDIVAASFDVPLNSRLTIDHPLLANRTFRVADRGRLSPTHIDVATWTLAEAYSLTSHSWTCWSLP